ncbi:FAD dependent oxidoreductase [Novosphingobium nitrogenifigens DSM 19370]|uniref:FAD dependent oxidoreductase n=1 Tax=Novosphingobium nitrogenifigens DSM 19370 TaxID=983920 RepID=F1ZAE8_9SPHN|nr:NAD(P)/FAD-dependent oxidoreductase [Novosphingobium nitrogenifigens]EGD58444.1 FAD dependent oxidoreductase [Novosphingobium nitrogenifigens DSM 19370]
MLRLTELKLPLDHSADDLEAAICDRLGIERPGLVRYSIAKRGNDARRKSAIQLVYAIDVTLSDEEAVAARHVGDKDVRPTPDTAYRFPVMAPAGWDGPRPVVIGAGPCGLLAGLILAQMGLRPIIVERGKAVRERTKDTWGLWRRSVLDPESNVQFGEGGAGTFSDGKLYSRIKDPRHLGRKVLVEFVKAGAPDDILYEAHPHIGTFRLVTMVMSMRETIEQLGGEYRFQTRVEDFEVEEDASGQRQLVGLHLSDGSFLPARHVVMAVGHSARDTFGVLHARGVHVEAKPFAIGVRIEHPQSWIDRARYGTFAGNKILGAAAYSATHQCSTRRTVYSFCMCPGGRVVAATSEKDRVVTNGMSQYSRAEFNANSGLVVDIDPSRDYPGGPLAGIEFQRKWESLAFVAGGGSYRAPGQKVGDLLAGRASSGDFGTVVPSYKPGVHLTDLAQCLPDYVLASIREALPVFGRQIPGYDHPDVIMTGVETRTSSPVRIRRGPDFQSINTRGLYPAGEGAGYAGGILSAAVDGIKVAEALALDLLAPAEANKVS